MRKIVLDIQNALFAKAVQRVLVQDLDEFQAVISDGPRRTLALCRQEGPQAVLMEVTPLSPRTLEERLTLRGDIAALDPRCKTVLLVDEVNHGDLALRVKQAKAEGLIDLFIYGSASASYMSALVDTL